eukprot:2197353-Rhodomonas_salina.1
MEGSAPFPPRSPYSLYQGSVVQKELSIQQELGMILRKCIDLGYDSTAVSGTDLGHHSTAGAGAAHGILEEQEGQRRGQRPRAGQTPPVKPGQTPLVKHPGSNWLKSSGFVLGGGGQVRDRERQRETEKQRETETETERQRDRHRRRERQRDRETATERATELSELWR